MVKVKQPFALYAIHLFRFMGEDEEKKLNSAH